MTEDELDLEFAVDQIFRSAYGADIALADRNADRLITVAAALVLARNELERRGWKWQPETQPTVAKTED